ncbi:MAG: hypothetical protein ACT6Q7_14060 [Blastomonas fulva]|uniref:hypothetical protein n=1 Tax=Blastomonas fulva TaxID=1550728 RepID=UPI004033F8A6
MTLSPAHEAAPRGQKQEARGQGETTIEVAFNGFASGNAATRHIDDLRNMSFEQLQAEAARREGWPAPRPRATVDDERLTELAKLQAAALDAMRIARSRGDDAAYIAAGRDHGGYEAEMRLLLPDDGKESSKLRRAMHRLCLAERERLRTQDWINRTTNAARQSAISSRGHDAPGQLEGR